MTTYDTRTGHVVNKETGGKPSCPLATKKKEAS